MSIVVVDVARVRADERKRVLCALTLSLVGCLALLVLHVPSLPAHTTIIGYPTFADYNYAIGVWNFRVAVYAFPILTICAYSALNRWGPLRGTDRSSRTQTDLAGAPALVLATDAQTGWDLRARCVLALGLPAVFVAFAIRFEPHTPAAETVLVRLASPVLYCLVTVALAVLLRARLGRRLGEGRQFAYFLWVANALMVGVAACGGLWLISHQTVAVQMNGVITHWRWIPWWLAVLGIAGTWWWTASRLRLGWSASVIEQRLRAVILGSAYTYAFAAVLPNALTSFEGFDPGQGLTGALLLQHGYFPWRDFQFYHGFFVDVSESLVGFHLFQQSAWGADAGIALVLLPLTWVGIYLLGVWATTRGSVVRLIPIALIVSGFFMDVRMLTIAPVLILLGAALRRERLTWTCALTAVLFFQGVLLPETEFQVVAILLVLLAADLVHRPAGRFSVGQLRRTWCVVITGAVLTVVWLLFLVAEGALKGFVDYYVMVGPGHYLEGAFRPKLTTFEWMMFVAMLLMVVGVVLTAAWRLHRRAPWTPLHWVTLAAAINSGIYGEQALGRFDSMHVDYSLDVGVSLFVLVLASSLPVLDRLVRAGLAWLVSPGPGLGWFARRGARPQWAAITTVVLMLLAVPGTIAHVWHAPRQTQVGLKRLATSQPLGYTARRALPKGLLQDLRTVASTYAPHDAPFWEMTNSPGFFYYLLGLRPASSFMEINQVLTEATQKMLMRDLRRTRPPLVVFSGPPTVGLPIMDGIPNGVRDFLVSQYILDHWTPVVTTHSFVFMLRDDLLKKRPPVPHLTKKPVTKDLYWADQAACSWGDAGDFLPSTATGASVLLRPTSVSNERQVKLTGWAFDPDSRKQPKHVAIVVGNKVAAVVPVGWPLKSAAAEAHFHTRSALDSGFLAQFATPDKGQVSAYAVTRNGTLRPIAGAVPSGSGRLTRLRMPNGRYMRVVRRRVGAMASSGAKPMRISSFTLPRGTSIASYELATFHAPNAIGQARLTLGSSLDVANGFYFENPDNIVAGTLPQVGSRLSVRVGSCIQWHGYRGRNLYLAQLGGNPVTSLTLSGVKS